VRTKTDVCRSLALWIDIGKDDPWAPLAQRFDRDLTELRIPHQWHMWPGDHSGAYWSAHLPEYLRYYDTALAGSPSWDTRLRLPLVY
jgi:S-formylglutathione hydrolase FrmB